MSTHKLAISLQPAVFALVDSAAKRLGLARSQYIAQVLTRDAAAVADRQVTEKLDEVYADANLGREQRATASLWDTAHVEAGTEW